VVTAATTADVIVMAAAVADFRPAARADAKIKKTGGPPPPIRLVENADILREISGLRRRAGQVIVGFAAETGDVIANGLAKLAAKGCDLLVVNQVGNGLAFGTPDNEAVILAADGDQLHFPQGPKEALADVILDLVADRLEPLPPDPGPQPPRLPRLHCGETAVRSSAGLPGREVDTWRVGCSLRSRLLRVIRTRWRIRSATPSSIR